MMRKIEEAVECFRKADDLESLFLVYSCSGDHDALAKIGEVAGRRPYEHWCNGEV